MFCVECGKEVKIYKEGVCINCYVKSHSFTLGPSIIDLTLCSHCGSFKFKNYWTNELFSDVIRRIIKNNFQINKELEKIEIETDCKDTKNGKDCIVVASGYLDGHQITEKHNLHVRLKMNVCDVCSKQFGGYHEAILQIRADTRELSKQELYDIQLEVESYVEDLKLKGNRALFITDIAKEHKGLDFYLSERSAGLAIAKRIQEIYGGEIKQSSKNVGMKDSKQIYRMTYLIRLPAFKKNDFIKLNDQFFRIISIQTKKVQMVNLSNWEKSTIEMKNLKQAIKIDENETIKNVIVVSQTDDDIQIMDEKTYKIRVIKKPKKIKFTEKTVEIVKLRDNIFLIPNKK
jgi:nonsense-mediated mRNA decay protein 3